MNEPIKFELPPRFAEQAEKAMKAFTDRMSGETLEIEATLSDGEGLRPGEYPLWDEIEQPPQVADMRWVCSYPPLHYFAGVYGGAYLFDDNTKSWLAARWTDEVSRNLPPLRESIRAVAVASEDFVSIDVLEANMIHDTPQVRVSLHYTIKEQESS